MMSTDLAPAPASSPRRASGPVSSTTLLTAALSGLLGLGAGGCGKDNNEEPDPDPIDAAQVDAPVIDAAPPIDAPATDASPIISETEGNRTFAQVEADCDARGGFTQIHAACSGSNSCAGFSYGDWDPGVTTEHTCAALNGCNGISCVVLKPDGGLTGKQVYEAELPESGPRSCTNCHADWSTKVPDITKFKVWIAPGSTRTAQNWLDTPAKLQARMVAFGSSGRLADGSAFSHMAAYHKVFSRAEIERAVEHIRSHTTVMIATIKLSDP